MSRPKCVQCGKALNKLTRSVDVPAEVKDDDLLQWLIDNPQARLPWGHEIPIEVGRIGKASRWTGVRSVRYWTGRWGRYGDNRFCGQTCGWRWAIKHAPEATS